MTDDEQHAPPSTDPAAILRTLAGLAPAARRQSFDVGGTGAPLLWLGTRQSSIAPASSQNVADASRAGLTVHGGAETRRLAALDALHAEERLLREGWIFLCGQIQVGDKMRPLCTPLMTQPIRLRRAFTAFALISAGDATLTDLVEDPVAAERLEAEAEFGGGALFDQTNASDTLIARLPNLQGWIQRVAAAAGLRVQRIVGPEHHPMTYRDGDELVAVVGSGIYAARDVNAVDVGSALLGWAGQPGLDDTAFAALYGLQPSTGGTPPPDGRSVLSPLPLTDAQRSVVARSRVAPVTLISGPPGCGKSHTLAAVAVDQVAQGRSVLVATQSVYAAEVLASLLQRQPAPVPVLFGNAESRQALADQMERFFSASDDAAVDQLERRSAVAAATVARLEEQALFITEQERRAAEAPRYEAIAASYAAMYPRLFDAASEPDAWADALADLRSVDGAGSGWWRRWRTRRRYRLLTGIDHAPIDLEHAIVVAQARRASATLASSGGTQLAGVWEALLRADADHRLALGAAIRARIARAATSSKSARAAGAGLAGALRASRSRRRELLRRLDADALVEALPLWVGTLADIEDLLPQVAGLFDVVLLDEASQIDQRAAPPALLRARRAVIAGDPRQLRHVSFVGDATVTSAIDEHGAHGVAQVLDVRRMSTYDVATAAAPLDWLGDHFRSVPHLIQFSSARFYDNRINLLTRRPATETADVISVARVASGRGGDGVNRAEVEQVRVLVDQLAGSGARSVGIVTPFRAHADALEKMLLDTFSLETIQALGLRVGTVHQFQGNERDTVIVSLALGPGESPTSKRFVDDPNLFNVMTTRARSNMIVVTSLPETSNGLIASFLEYAERGPEPARAAGEPTGWTGALAEELRRGGVTTRTAYPVGRWAVDICTVDASGPVAVDCTVDEGGVRAHVEKHRQLAAAGWRFLDGYASRFGGDCATAALTLARELRELNR